MPSRHRCVIKRLKPNFSTDRAYELAKKGFAREAATLETLGDNHPQIPLLYGYFEEEHQFYLVQELIEGQPWDIILKRRNLGSASVILEFVLVAKMALDW